MIKQNDAEKKDRMKRAKIIMRAKIIAVLVPSVMVSLAWAEDGSGSEEQEEARPLDGFYERSLYLREAMVRDAQTWKEAIETLMYRIDARHLEVVAPDALDKIQEDIQKKLSEIADISPELEDIKSPLSQLLNKMRDLFYDVRGSSVPQAYAAYDSGRVFLEKNEKYLAKLQELLHQQEATKVAPAPATFDKERRGHNDRIAKFVTVRDGLHHSIDMITMIDRTIELYNPSLFGMMPFAKKNLQAKLEKAIELARETSLLVAHYSDMARVEHPSRQEKQEMARLQRSKETKTKELYELIISIGQDFEELEDVKRHTAERLGGAREGSRREERQRLVHLEKGKKSKTKHC